MKKRVFLVGAGVSCPLGSSVAEVFAGIAAGNQATGELTVIDATAFPTRLAAEARSAGVPIAVQPGADRKAMLFRRSLSELVGQLAGLPFYMPISMGTGIDHFDFPGFAEAAATDPESWRRFNIHSCQVAEDVVREHGLQGRLQVNVAACVASSQAMGLAFRMVRNGLHPAVITGGFDSMLSHLHYMGFYKLGALSSWTGSPAEACRPFDKDRSGIVLGEGAAVFALVSGDAVAGRPILAEIAGYGSSMDAYLVTDPEPEGKLLARAALEAIHDAGLTPQDIDCVHLHGTGTFKNDLAETAAMQLVFGEAYTRIPVFSLKGQVGHLIGSCGAVEMLGVLYSLRNQEIPITVNSTTPDPAIPLLVARTQPIATPIRHVLKLNAAFGGQNTALVVSRYDR